MATPRNSTAGATKAATTTTTTTTKKSTLAAILFRKSVSNYIHHHHYFSQHHYHHRPYYRYDYVKAIFLATMIISFQNMEPVSAFNYSEKALTRSCAELSCANHNACHTATDNGTQEGHAYCQCHGEWAGLRCQSKLHVMTSSVSSTSASLRIRAMTSSPQPASSSSSPASFKSVSPSKLYITDFSVSFWNLNASAVGCSILRLKSLRTRVTIKGLDNGQDYMVCVANGGMDLCSLRSADVSQISRKSNCVRVSTSLSEDPPFNIITYVIIPILVVVFIVIVLSILILKRKSMPVQFILYFFCCRKCYCCRKRSIRKKQHLIRSNRNTSGNFLLPPDPDHTLDDSLSFGARSFLSNSAISGAGNRSSVISDSLRSGFTPDSEERYSAFPEDNPNPLLNPNSLSGLDSHPFEEPSKSLLPVCSGSVDYTGDINYTYTHFNTLPLRQNSSPATFCTSSTTTDYNTLPYFLHRETNEDPQLSNTNTRPYNVLDSFNSTNNNTPLSCVTSHPVTTDGDNNYDTSVLTSSYDNNTQTPLQINNSTSEYYNITANNHQYPSDHHPQQFKPNIPHPPSAHTTPQSPTNQPTHLHTNSHDHQPTHLHTNSHDHQPTHLHTNSHDHQPTHLHTNAHDHQPTHLHTNAHDHQPTTHSFHSQSVQNQSVLPNGKPRLFRRHYSTPYGEVGEEPPEVTQSPTGSVRVFPHDNEWTRHIQRTYNYNNNNNNSPAPHQSTFAADPNTPLYGLNTGYLRGSLRRKRRQPIMKRRPLSYDFDYHKRYLSDYEKSHHGQTADQPTDPLSPSIHCPPSIPMDYRADPPSASKEVYAVATLPRRYNYNHRLVHSTTTTTTTTTTTNPHTIHPHNYPHPHPSRPLFSRSYSNSEFPHHHSSSSSSLSTTTKENNINNNYPNKCQFNRHYTDQVSNPNPSNQQRIPNGKEDTQSMSSSYTESSVSKDSNNSNELPVRKKRVKSIIGQFEKSLPPIFKQNSRRNSTTFCDEEFFKDLSSPLHQEKIRTRGRNSNSRKKKQRPLSQPVMFEFTGNTPSLLGENAEVGLDPMFQGHPSKHNLPPLTLGEDEETSNNNNNHNMNSGEPTAIVADTENCSIKMPLVAKNVDVAVAAQTQATPDDVTNTSSTTSRRKVVADTYVISAFDDDPTNLVTPFIVKKSSSEESLHT